MHQPRHALAREDEYDGGDQRCDDRDCEARELGRLGRDEVFDRGVRPDLEAPGLDQTAERRGEREPGRQPQRPERDHEHPSELLRSRLADFFVSPWIFHLRRSA